MKASAVSLRTLHADAMLGLLWIAQAFQRRGIGTAAYPLIILEKALDTSA